jgi:hypothetical protein
MKPFLPDDEIARRLRVIEREARDANFTRWADELRRVAEVLEQEDTAPQPERR